MTPSNTNSSGSKKGNRRTVAVEPPPLARYLALAKYAPEIGDFIIWSGWLRTWYGVVADVSPDGLVLTVIWEGLPMLLFTLTDGEQRSSSKPLLLEKIVGSKPGQFAVMKHDSQHNATIWFV